MVTTRRIVLAALTSLAPIVASTDQPIGPQTAARSIHLGSVELIWSNTYLLTRDYFTHEVHMIAEDRNSVTTVAGGESRGSRSDYQLESIVGPFATFTVSTETTGQVSKPPMRTVIRLYGGQPQPGDIRTSWMLCGASTARSSRRV